MIKIMLKVGYIAYQTTKQELLKIGGLGKCDDCCQYSDTGYLVPVLNYWMCPACFHSWENSAVYYPKDKPFEKITADVYESLIPMSLKSGAGIDDGQ